MADQILTASDLAERYGVNRTTIWRWRQKGELPRPEITHNGAIWLLSTVEAWEKRQKAAKK